MSGKAVISNRIYFKGTDLLIDTVKKALTYRIETKIATRGNKIQLAVETIRHYKTLPHGVISIPRGRVDLIPEEYEIVDKRSTHEVPFPNTRHPLREGQQEVYDKADGDCFINALPGWGKTFTALHIAKKLGQKTLVITHTTMLRDQWIKEVRELFGIDPGVISAGVFDIEDHAIVIGNVQTVTKHALDICKEFGTVIMDEAHHSPATTFTEILDASYARNRIGLSGTMKRKDGKHVLLRDYFGNKVFVPPQSHTLNPTVKLVKTGIHLTPGAVWAKKINNLLYDEDYQEYVAVIAATQISKGHSVLIIADRVEFLQNVQQRIGETCLLVTGETEFKERERVKEAINSGQKTCIAGSRQIFSEGISIDRLSSVILATPISNEGLLEQIIGRIMRPFEGKPHPEVIDLQFAGFADKKQNNLRLGFYLNKGWDVVAI